MFWKKLNWQQLNQTRLVNTLMYVRKILKNEVPTSISDQFHISMNEQYNLRHEWQISIYNIANVNSERWLAKSRVDITLCQNGKFPATLLLKFFVLYYKRNIKHFFRIDIQLYQHSWKLEKLEIVWKHSALRASCFHTISRFSNFHSCWYNCISTRKMFYIS